MNLIYPSVELIEESTPERQIERIGRICYKSEDKITEDSAPKFVQMLANRKHYAMLEHGVIHFVFERLSDEVDLAEQYVCNIPGIVVSKIGPDKWLITASMSHIYNPQYHTPWLLKIMTELVKSDDCIYLGQEGRFRLSRVSWEYIQNLIHGNPYGRKIYENHAFISAHLICDRGVSHELVRHRCAAAQESTRYCNYSSDKFSSEITYIVPSTFDLWDADTIVEFGDVLANCERVYMDMLNRGYKPQQARAVLPNALKTEVVLTMSRARWEHFLNLRSRGTTGAPHPDMKVLADQLIPLIEAYDVTHS